MDPYGSPHAQPDALNYRPDGCFVRGGPEPNRGDPAVLVT
jgi:hypothetical protein